MLQAQAFLEESQQVFDLLQAQPSEDLLRTTQFKSWSIEDIVRHLYVWNSAAIATLGSAERFREFFRPVPTHTKNGMLRDFERAIVRISGGELVDLWRKNFVDTAIAFSAADPSVRLEWGGPPLSARSCITSRLMETWAHGQAIYDELGVERTNTDRLKDVAEIGVRTFEWTFANRGLPVPGRPPKIELVAPSGAHWRWDGEAAHDTISGSAVDFCQVVTQVRNIADTQLTVTGAIGRQWMSIAQCFAGPPNDPPAPGTRYRKVREGRSVKT